MALKGFVRLTWGEFKCLVDDAGASDDTVIEYIDIGSHDLDRRDTEPPASTNIVVGLGKGAFEGRLEVC